MRLCPTHVARSVVSVLETWESCENGDGDAGVVAVYGIGVLFVTVDTPVRQAGNNRPPPAMPVQ